MPEREGWVDRKKLLDFHVRNRKPQIALAQEFGFDDYASPAGGCCFLTDPSYATKLADLWHARHAKRYELDDIMLLKVGRHIRPEPGCKLIVGREKGENNFLSGYRKNFTCIETRNCGGPLTLIDGETNDEDLETASRIVARFSQGKNEERVTVKITFTNGDEKTMDVSPMQASEIKQEWYVLP